MERYQPTCLKDLSDGVLQRLHVPFLKQACHFAYGGSEPPCVLQTKVTDDIKEGAKGSGHPADHFGKVGSSVMSCLAKRLPIFVSKPRSNPFHLITW